jgi:hypothetical protein
MLLRAFACLVATLAFFVDWSERGEARAEEFNFSPSSCATDPGDTIHLALGRTVLRVPLDSLVYILDLHVEERTEAPPVPDPSQPEGCPDHPVQARSFTLRAALTEFGGGGDRADNAATQYVPFKLVLSTPDEWGIQPSAERRFAERCSSFGIWDELENGLVACRVRFEDAPEMDNDSAIIYQARPDVYSAPFGRPFVIDCFQLLLIGSQTCYNVYKLYRTVNFARKFDLQRVDAADLVDIDRALRAWIETTRVADYQWLTVDSP